MRRLKYLTKWGHAQLLACEEAPHEWRCRVIEEVALPFFPWVQRTHFARLEGDVVQYLMPLYLLFHRQRVRETLLVSVRVAATEFDNGRHNGEHLSRCRTLFSIVLDTVSVIEKLDAATYVELRAGISSHHQCFPTPQIKDRRHKLVEVVQILRRLLERKDVRAASQKVSSNALPSSSHRPAQMRVARSELAHGVDYISDEDEFLSCFGAEDDLEDGTMNDFIHGGASVPDRYASGSSSSSSAVNRPACVPCEKRYMLFPKGSGRHTWKPSPPETFKVRSDSYLRDRLKLPSGPCTFETAHIEIAGVGPAGPVWRVGKHKDFYPAMRRRMGDKRFFFIMNFVCPPYQHILVGALDPSASWLQTDSPQARLWNRFLEMEPEQQKDHLKVIMSLEEGPFFISKIIPRKPLIIARKLKTYTHYEPGDHLEFVINVASSKSDEYIVGIVLKALAYLKMSVAALIEGRSEDELPETLLLCAQFEFVDISRVVIPCTDRDS
jgi:hypothetical protein